MIGIHGLMGKPAMRFAKIETGGGIEALGLNLPLGSHTVSFWLKPFSLVDYNQHLGDAWGSFAFHSAADGRVYAGNYVNNTDANRIVTPSGALVVNKLTHIAFVYEASTNESGLYINGSGYTWKTFLSDPVNPLAKFGLSSTHGLVADVRFYTSGKMPAEVKKIYERQLDMNNLALWWKLEKDTQDYSGNNRHGTASGNVTFV